MTIQEIIKKKRIGDNKMVAEILGLSPENVKKILRRPRAKRHKIVLEVFEKLIVSRENIKKSIFYKPSKS